MSDIMLPCELLAPLESLQKQHECDPSCVTTKQELGSLYLRLVDTAWLQVATTPVPDAVRDILNLIHMALDLGVQLSVYERIELHFRTAAAFHYLGRHTDCMAQIEQAINRFGTLIAPYLETRKRDGVDDAKPL